MSWLYIFLALALFQNGMAIDAADDQGDIPRDERGSGYRMVDNGTIKNCGVNTKQQCFQIDPFKNLSISTLYNMTAIDISCQSDGRCVVPYDFDDTEGEKLVIFVHCLNNAGQEVTSTYVRMDLGRTSVEHRSAYSYFTAVGYNVNAKWETDAGFTSNVSLRDFENEKKGETNSDKFLVRSTER
ncbi:uncharacterized protein FA14DRAFT_153312 [Meira miltonrushii]|uniref:Uncharacterized protein n=1 Tax=Meira miltonrushii TaxID=1280837 RepID=A0A316VLL8_9BASI|nr:uncharacterized protein FA14DRAFT_153312 [Meira miltonrushii]PWN37968.1 hypothetical protein FA14DRAFT_153312 [Meira miltonrushii]